MKPPQAPLESAPGSPEPAAGGIIPPTEAQARTNAGVARATGVLALGNVASRVAGLARDITLTNLFGATAAMDALTAAVLVPRSLYDLLIGGHVNGAIIPVLSEVVTVKGREELWRLVSVLLSMITVILALLVTLLQISAPLVVQVIASGSDAATQAQAAHLLRIISPALIFMGLFAILSGTLYALRVFTWPAFATTVFNASIVTVTLILVPGPQFIPQLAHGSPAWALMRPDDSVTAAAIGWLVGSIAYVLLQLPGLRGARLRFTLRWRHPYLRQIGLLYVPVLFSLVMDTLIIRPFSYSLATQTGAGNLTIMERATTLIQFPQGLVATAISVAILPTLARQAALIAASIRDNRQPDGDDPAAAFKDTLGLGLRLTMTLILPATVGLFVLATPIITLVFQHGAFTAADTEVTSLVLRLYLIGLPFAALDLLLVYAFYARQDTLTPALVGVVSLGVYMAVALALVPRLGLYSLMIADSAKHLTHASICAVLLHRRIGGLGQQRLLLTAVRTGAAVLVMGVATVLLLPLATSAIGTQGVLREMALVVSVGGISALIFVVLAYVLKIEEWRWLLSMARQRLRRP